MQAAEADVPARATGDWYAHLVRMGRVERARQCTLKRSARIRRAIRQAIGALPLDHPQLVDLVLKRMQRKGPARYFLKRLPDRRTVRGEIALERARRGL